MVRIDIDDDGPGLDEAGMVEAVKRGRRLDETKPGTGLGLSIVDEIASEYQGGFALARAESGGLSARLTLPGAGDRGGALFANQLAQVGMPEDRRAIRTKSRRSTVQVRVCVTMPPQRRGKKIRRLIERAGGIGPQTARNGCMAYSV
jgi:K+-sensing histidine kinase KdpD